MLTSWLEHLFTLQWLSELHSMCTTCVQNLQFYAIFFSSYHLCLWLMSLCFGSYSTLPISLLCNHTLAMVFLQVHFKPQTWVSKFELCMFFI